MKRVERILSGLGRGLQVLWWVINLPIVLFWGLISLIRTVLGLALLCGLGFLVYEFYTHYQAQQRPAQVRSAGSAGVARGRPSGEEQRPAGAWQSKEDRRLEAAAAKRAGARYQAAQRRLLA